MLPVADGLALAAQLRGEPRVAAAFVGDGGTSEGDFHEAVNLAAVWKLPVIFVVENNQYGLSTPVREQFACEDLADARRRLRHARRDLRRQRPARGASRRRARRRRARARGDGPTLLEFKTFRMRGHEEASGTAYVPPALFEEWARARSDRALRADARRARRAAGRRARRAARASSWTRSTRSPIGCSPRPSRSRSAERELADVYAPSPASAREPTPRAVAPRVRRCATSTPSPTALRAGDAPRPRRRC